MTELSNAFKSILPNIAVTGQSGSTAQYASKGGKKAAKKSSKKAAKKSSKKSAKKGATRKLFSFLGF
jgi:hypothetical protein